MSKQKRNRGKPADRLSKKTHTISVPRVGAVELSPSRASTTPFCAYYGPHGETCSNTIGLKMVATLPVFQPISIWPALCIMMQYIRWCRHFSPT